MRYRHSGVVFDNKMWIMGGDKADKNNAISNDVWYSSDGITWTQATSAAQWPPRDNFAAVAFNNKIWVMGGFYADANGMNVCSYNDVWSSSDGKAWTIVTANAQWSGRECLSAAVFDNKMWLLGGNGMNDMWNSSDGANWKKVTDAAEWSRRELFGMATFNNKLWVIGGYNEKGNLNDVWYLQGVTGADGQLKHQAANNFLLETIGPNPFRDNIQIRFLTSRAAPVTLRILNAAGREVTVLSSVNVREGEHTVTWNGLGKSGAPMPGGTYLVQYKAGESTTARLIIKSERIR